MKPLKADKLDGYIIEPTLTEPSAGWEGHHTTNPTVIRLSCDRRVFLGYRAGGHEDRYMLQNKMIWGSSLGLAILDERGEKVVHRLPWPIMRINRKFSLPLTEQEYNEYIVEHKENIVVLHDFRFYEYEGYLHVIYHDGALGMAYDCVKRMPVDLFLQKVEKSIALFGEPVESIREEWARIWWKENTWEPCGTGESRLIYPSRNNKNDIVYFKKPDDTLQMCHRPLPDIAVMDTGHRLHAGVTPDGITTYGVLESCVRPGYFDNCHIGNNGMPTRAKIGDLDVWVDVIHGVHNRMLSDSSQQTSLYTYLPYLRIKDYETGELLYYSQEPILEADAVWREYVEEGAWVRQLPFHDAIMFAGGQIEVEQGRNGLDDLFMVYMGVGDTAVARAVFTLRQLLPEAVLKDLAVWKAHRAHVIEAADMEKSGNSTENTPCEFPETLSGWQWRLENDPTHRQIHIIRQLQTRTGLEKARRPVFPIPGSFDADGIFFDGRSIRKVDDLGWFLVYRGCRWEESGGQLGGQKFTQTGYGILILDRENPERILYRSTEPVGSYTDKTEGWNFGGNFGEAGSILEEAEKHVPEKVLFEIRRINSLIDAGKFWRSHMTAWLKNKAAKAAKTEE
ncbi:MAG TPA: hypothetical protein DD727_08485 [Clostridiales bacterium]|nr:hypothetical protein [Clostridiales bacterium]